MKERFEEIYSSNEWGHGSGEGSLPIHTKGYVTFLERFLEKRRISSVVDLGCGDWQFSRQIKWGNTRYAGYDIVASVIEANQKRYATPNITFDLYSGNPEELPPADLLIAKDVLQHWSNEAIERFLPTLSRYKLVLITNCVNPTGKTVNTNIKDGDFRYLDIRLPPFSVKATKLYSFTNSRNPIKALFQPPRWLKHVLLVQP